MLASCPQAQRALTAAKTEYETVHQRVMEVHRACINYPNGWYHLVGFYREICESPCKHKVALLNFPLTCVMDYV